MKIIEIYLLLINFTAILLVGADKQKARKGKWRVRERTFFLVSLLGGSIGTYLAMRGFHHKTLHKRFMLGIPLIFWTQVVLFVVCWRSGIPEIVWG